jgi:hypothetical protein
VTGGRTIYRDGATGDRVSTLKDEDGEYLITIAGGGALAVEPGHVPALMGALEAIRRDAAEQPRIVLADVIAIRASS